MPPAAACVSRTTREHVELDLAVFGVEVELVEIARTMPKPALLTRRVDVARRALRRVASSAGSVRSAASTSQWFAVLGFELLRQRFESSPVARDEHEVVAALGEHAGRTARRSRATRR